MAKQLKKIFIPATDEVVQNFRIQSWHVSQSVDAFTAAQDYDISISGSLTTSGSVTFKGLSTTTGQTDVLVLDGDIIKKQTATLGTSGTSGSSGTSGISGSSGTSGSSGISGSSGTTGTSGSSGTTGTSGSSGTTGTSGSSGTTGTSGSSGTSGQSIAGSSGTSGISGSSGTSGVAGSSGTSGASNGTMGFTEPGSFTAVSISDYYLPETDIWTIQFTNGNAPNLNGRITVNSTDSTAVTQLVIAAKNSSTTTEPSIPKIIKGTQIKMGTVGVGGVLYVAKDDATAGGDPSYSYYTVQVAFKRLTSGVAPTWAASGVENFSVLNPVNIQIGPGYSKHQITYESNINSGTQLVQLPIRFLNNTSCNVGDISLVEFKGVPTNGTSGGGFVENAAIEYITVSGSANEVYSNYEVAQSPFSTGSGFATLMTAQSQSLQGFVLLGNNQYV